VLADEPVVKNSCTASSILSGDQFVPAWRTFRFPIEMPAVIANLESLTADSNSAMAVPRRSRAALGP